MKKLFLFSYCIFLGSFVCAQVKIAPNTSLNSGSQAIFTTGISISNESALVNLPVLQLENSASISTSQNLIISSGLKLFSGKASFTGLGKVLYAGDGEAISFDEHNYIISGFYALGGGNKVYPIGTPAELAEAEIIISGASDSLVSSMIVYNQDPAIDPSSIPIGIDAVSKNWYWEFVAEGEYSTVKPSLSVNTPDDLLLENGSTNLALVILESNTEKNTINKLGRGGASNTAMVRASNNGTGPLFFLGVTKDVKLVINQVITPNQDGVNDKLEIENLDVFAGSYEILLLDRYGGIIWRSTNLGEDENFDFLEPGNYICIVNYPADEPAKQMITVVK